MAIVWRQSRIGRYMLKVFLIQISECEDRSCCFFLFRTHIRPPLRPVSTTRERVSSHRVVKKRKMGQKVGQHKLLFALQQS